MQKIAASSSRSTIRVGTVFIGIRTAPSIWQVWNSHGSRTSSSTGWAVVPSASHAASSGAVIVFIGIPSELEMGRDKRVAQWLDIGLENLDGVIRCIGYARNDLRRHDRRFADDREQASAGLELFQERLGQHRQRSGNHDHVILR